MNTEQLDKLVFHDLPVETVILDKLNQNLIFKVLIFDESSKKYNCKIIEFQKVTIIHFDKIILEKHEELEIYSFDYKYENQVFHGNMILLLGFGKPSIIIKFKCKKVHIQ